LNRALARKLQVLVDEGGAVDQVYEASRWSTRVQKFIQTAIGEEQASDFISLTSHDAFDTVASQRGYLEGLIVLEEGEDPMEGSHSKKLDSRKVFVVHGRDEAAKEGVARFIEKVGLQPIILHEQANAGRTIIEKFEVYSGDVAFAVVLLTPDDVGSAAGEVSNTRPRARQNVIMELGYFIGRLGRTRVCALHKGNVELPSDYQGVVYVEMDGGGAWKSKVAQELVQSKISIDLTGLLGG
jgi:predicted nucleotide-binding protein